MSAQKDAAGFVLVGGRSSRMGIDKASLLYRDVPMALHIARRIEPLVDQVRLVGDPATHGHLGLPVLRDEHPGSGPTSAIVTALRASEATFNIVTACDVPAVRTEIFAEMLARLENTDLQCLVPVTPDGREQVLCAVYRKDALGLLDCGEARLRTAIRRLRVGYWHVESGSWALNVNTPSEWDEFRNGGAL
jgi:molybdopterin-guanine dinucleotide biosynthesis protein A